MEKQYLHSGWVLNGSKFKDIPATVPGCVHTDLRKQNLIPDYFWRDNNDQVRWVEDQEWIYTCCFEAKTDVPVKLVFEGLDTYCNITLNGELLGGADNMFIPHIFDVTGKLQKQNTLEVHFRPPMAETADLPELLTIFSGGRNYTRRVQCTYGWDWVDRFVTMGIWMPVYLEYGNDIHVDNLYVYTEFIDKFGAQIGLQINTADYQQGGIFHIEIVDPKGKVICKEDVYSHEPKLVRIYDIRNPQLWYPRGYGDQPLYKVRVSVGENHYEEHFGIRTIRILQQPDEVGSAYYEKSKYLQKNAPNKGKDFNEEFSTFQVIVNGTPVFCMGADWVPCEPFPSDATTERYEKLVQMAADMKINMLRVWGGGIFESKAFYDACDRLGILVQQDFLMACAKYPEDQDWFLEHLRKEAAYAAILLRNHPCLAWWNGDNENATAGNDIQEDYRGREAALAGLAPSIYEHDPKRQFLRSSPFGGNCYASITKGTTHNTNFLGKLFDYFLGDDCSDYKEFLGSFQARFISEEPVFGAISEASMERFMLPEDFIDQEEKMLRFHTKGNPSLPMELFDYFKPFVSKVLGEFKNDEDRLFKYRYIQYEWTRVMLEVHRRNTGYCNGILFWMFNDCWPAALGWAYVDYYCIPKAGFYAFAHSANHIAPSITVEDGKYILHLPNDAGATEATVTAHLRSGDGSWKKEEFYVSVGEYGVTERALPWEYDQDALVVCDVTAHGEVSRTFYKNGALHLQKNTDAVQILDCTEDSVTVTAASYVHVVELLGDCVFHDNYFSLLPGEVKCIKFQALEDAENSKVTFRAYDF